MKTFIQFLMIFLLCYSQGAQARVLTWKECVDMVIENNADLKAAQETFKATNELEGVVRGPFLPQVAGIASGKHENDPDTGLSAKSYNARLELTQNLFAGFSDLSKSRQAKANTGTAKAALNVAKARISAELKQAYESVLFARDSQRQTQITMNRREENLRIVELRYQSGLENKGSVLLSRAYYAQAKFDDRQAKRIQQTSRAQLAKLLGLDEAAEIEINEPVPVTEPTAEPNFEKMAAETPDVMQARSQEASTNFGLDIARAQFLPSLDFKGVQGKTDSIFYPNQPNRWSMELTLTLPLFNGGKDYSATRSAAATNRAAVQTRTNAERNSIVKLRQAYSDYVDSVEKARIDDDFKKAAEVRAEIARSKYNNGLMTFEDWDRVENDLIDRQKNAINSARNRVNAESVWEQTQGTGVIQ